MQNNLPRIVQSGCRVCRYITLLLLSHFLFTDLVGQYYLFMTTVFVFLLGGLLKFDYGNVFTLLTIGQYLEY